jgi:hypothetical protein
MKLKLYLVEHDIPQTQLSTQTGLSTFTLNGVVTGRIRPTQRVRQTIAQALGLSSGALFFGIEDPTEDELAEVERQGSMPVIDDQTIEKLRQLLFPTSHCSGTPTKS